MATTVKLSRLERVLDDLSYPVSRDEAATELSDVTVLFADGEADLGELISDVSSPTFESLDDLKSELHNVLPVEAVGEPGQSEGEG